MRVRIRVPCRTPALAFYTFVGNVSVDALNLTSTRGAVSDALLLVLNSSTAEALWFATITNTEDERTSSLHVKVVEDSIDMTCHGGCHQVTSSASAVIVNFQGHHKGGIAKLGTDGTPLWTADTTGATTPYENGLAVSVDFVDVSFYQTTETVTFGDVTYDSWGAECFDSGDVTS